MNNQGNKPEIKPSKFAGWLVTLAKNAYFAYGDVTDHKNYQGLPMPEWNDLPEKIQEAWVGAALAVRECTLSEAKMAVEFRNGRYIFSNEDAAKNE